MPKRKPSNYLEFILSQEGLRTFELKDDAYILLAYFLSTFRDTDLIELIEMFEEVESESKTFDEVYDPNGYLSFGNGSGYIELDKTTAYFVSESPEAEPGFDMPLKELIAIMKKWSHWR